MQRERILVVDDDPFVRSLAEISLGEIGHMSVLVAGSGDEAVEVAARERPDAILLDCLMPGKDGCETLEALRALPSCAGVPVLLLTGLDEGPEVARCRAQGVAGVLRKPFDPRTLSASVRRALAAPAAGGARGGVSPPRATA